MKVPEGLAAAKTHSESKLRIQGNGDSLVESTALALPNGSHTRGVRWRVQWSGALGLTIQVVVYLGNLALQWKFSFRGSGAETYT